jgi:hypothetical protein
MVSLTLGLCGNPPEILTNPCQIIPIDAAPVTLRGATFIGGAIPHRGKAICRMANRKDRDPRQLRTTNHGLSPTERRRMSTVWSPRRRPRMAVAMQRFSKRRAAPVALGPNRASSLASVFRRVELDRTVSSKTSSNAFSAALFPESTTRSTANPRMGAPAWDKAPSATRTTTGSMHPLATSINARDSAGPVKSFWFRRICSSASKASRISGTCPPNVVARRLSSAHCARIRRSQRLLAIGSVYRRIMPGEFGPEKCSSHHSERLDSRSKYGKTLGPSAPREMD